MGKQPPAQGFQPMKEASTNYADGPGVPGFTVEDGIAAKEGGLREARKLAPLGEITEPTQHGRTPNVRQPRRTARQRLRAKARSNHRPRHRQVGSLGSFPTGAELRHARSLGRYSSACRPVVLCLYPARVMLSV
jgi:hypothetical protein